MSKTEVDKTDGCMEPEACIQHIESLGCGNQTGADFFPDGGYQAWLTVIAGWLTLVASIGFTNALAVFQSYYGTTILSEYNADDIAWIGSIQFWGCFFFGLWAGNLSDRYGPRIPLGIGTLFLVLGIMTASVSKEFYQFILSQGFCIGLGCGFVFPPALAIQSQWFLKKRGFAVGLVISGQNLGGTMFPSVYFLCARQLTCFVFLGAIWPIVVNRLINHHGLSLAWSLRTIGFIQLFIMCIATLLAQPRFRKIPRQPVPLKAFVTTFKNASFTFSTLVFFFAIFIPYVSDSLQLQSL